MPIPDDYSGDPCQTVLSPLQDSGVDPSGVPLPSELTDEQCQIAVAHLKDEDVKYLEGRVADLETQLAEAKQDSNVIPTKRLDITAVGWSTIPKSGLVGRIEELERQLADAKSTFTVPSGFVMMLKTDADDLSKQLAEAKAALALCQISTDETQKLMAVAVKNLQAALDRERVALAEAEEDATEQSKRAEFAWKKNRELGEELDREREARLRAEAGLAVMLSAVEKLWNNRHIGAVVIDMADVAEMVREVRSTDTGARLAAVLEEVRGMPCENVRFNNDGCRGLYDKYAWCIRCKLVDAMEARSVP